MIATRQCRYAIALGAIPYDCPDAIAPTNGEMNDGGQRGQYELALLTQSGTEVHARRQVDDKPGLELAIGDRPTDVRNRGAGRHRPVHHPHVVARYVLPRLTRLTPRPRNKAEIVAL